MVCCIGASIQFIAKWHHFVGFDDLPAIGVAVSFLIMSNVLFSIGIGRRLSSPVRITPYNEYSGTKEEYKEYKARERFRFTGGEKFCFLICAIIIIYTMSTTVSAQFNKHLEAQAAQGITATKSDKENLDGVLKDIEKEKNPVITRNDGLVEEYTKSIDLLQKETVQINASIAALGTMPEEKTKLSYWYSTQKGYNTRLTEIQAAIKDNQDKKERLLIPPAINYDRIKTLEAQRDALQAKGVGREDIFSFLSGIFNTTPDLMQFVLSLFPAILIDLLAPIASAIFFYGIAGLVGAAGIEVKKEEELQAAYVEGAEEAFKRVREVAR
jgi:hypothetical protein